MATSWKPSASLSAPARSGAWRTGSLQTLTCRQQGKSPSEVSESGVGGRFFPFIWRRNRCQKADSSSSKPEKVPTNPYMPVTGKIPFGDVRIGGWRAVFPFIWRMNGCQKVDLSSWKPEQGPYKPLRDSYKPEHRRPGRPTYAESSAELSVRALASPLTWAWISSSIRLESQSEGVRRTIGLLNGEA